MVKCRTEYEEFEEFSHLWVVGNRINLIFARLVVRLRSKVWNWLASYKFILYISYFLTRPRAGMLHSRYSVVYKCSVKKHIAFIMLNTTLFDWLIDCFYRFYIYLYRYVYWSRALTVSRSPLNPLLTLWKASARTGEGGYCLCWQPMGKMNFVVQLSLKRFKYVGNREKQRKVNDQSSLRRLVILYD